MDCERDSYVIVQNIIYNTMRVSHYRGINYFDRNQSNTATSGFELELQKLK